MTTRRACVVGYPVAHSRSPLIHRHWLAEHKVDGDYVLEEVAPENIAGFFAGLAARGYVGANVTVPHKEAAFRALARAEPVAAALKAANTIWLENGRLAGTNTDVYGFLAHIDETVPGWDKHARHAVVLGAGGSSRAIVYGLLQRGLARVSVVNRTRTRAEAVAREFGDRLAPASYQDLPQLLKDADLLVNTTTLGMTGQPALQIDLAPLPPTAIVCDIVYVPLDTPLLVAARARGLRTVDGLGMLLHQAVPGFERWFGVKPSVTPALRARVLADLRAKERA